MNGMLNGISIIPNSESLKECMALLKPFDKDIAVTVHLNIIEGHSMMPAEEVSLLTDENGVFRVSFGKLLICSFLPGRKVYREQLKKELRAQIDAIKAFFPEDADIRLDGHAHYHMIPVVFDALVDVILEEHLKVSYIRMPKEYPSLYLRHWKCLKNILPINLIKVLVLNILTWRNERKYKHILTRRNQKIFLGVLLSGRMYRENVLPVIPDAIKLAKKRKQNIEILAHPGGVFEEQDIAKLTNPDDIAFLTSEARREEAKLFFVGENVREYCTCKN